MQAAILGCADVDMVSGMAESAKAEIDRTLAKYIFETRGPGFKHPLQFVKRDSRGQDQCFHLPGLTKQPK